MTRATGEGAVLMPHVIVTVIAERHRVVVRTLRTGPARLEMVRLRRCVLVGFLSAVEARQRAHEA